MSDIPFLGEILALAAPLAWSFAVILFRKTGETVPPLALNLFKNVVATVLFLLTLQILGGQLFESSRRADYLLLVLSGMIGIGLSDTLFFMTLNRVGAGIQAIINTSYSPSIIFLSILFLGERLSGVQILGVALILGAVLSVGWMKGPDRGLSTRTLLAGIGLGLLATLTQAVSIVMIKPLLSDSSLIWANCWRMFGGLLAASGVLFAGGPHREGVRMLARVGSWKAMLPATVVGTYFSLLLWLGGMKYTQASTAAALNQTSTLWTFLLAAWLLKEKVTLLRVAGLLVGACGVALVTFFRAS